MDLEKRVFDLLEEQLASKVSQMLRERQNDKPE